MFVAVCRKYLRQGILQGDARRRAARAATDPPYGTHVPYPSGTKPEHISYPSICATWRLDCVRDRRCCAQCAWAKRRPKGLYSTRACVRTQDAVCVSYLFVCAPVWE
jgi:hypothetical protein